MCIGASRPCGCKVRGPCICGPCSCVRYFTRLVPGAAPYSSNVVQAIPIAITQGNKPYHWRPRICQILKAHSRVRPHYNMAYLAWMLEDSLGCTRTFDMTAEQCGCRVSRGSISTFCYYCWTRQEFRLHKHRDTGTVVVYLLIIKTIPDDLTAKDICLIKRFSARLFGRDLPKARFVQDSNPIRWSSLFYAPSKIKPLEDHWNTYQFENKTSPALQKLMTRDQDPFRSGLVL